MNGMSVMDKKIFMSRSLPGTALEMLKKTFSCVEVNPHDKTLSRDEFVRCAKDKDGLVVCLSDKIDKEMFDALPNLKGIANYAVGYNNIDINEAKKRGIPVSNTPDVLTDTTAELAMALMLSVSRRIVESDSYLRDGKWKQWSPAMLLGTDLAHKTLGIIGAGRIGTAVGRMSSGFNMNIIYHNRKTRSVELENKYNAKYVDLDTLLKESDFISINTPLNNSTNHMITEAEIRKMKNTAIIINTARGQVIKESDLVKCLNEKVIAGAGLDVFEFEPQVTEDLCKMPNVVLTPHIGSGTVETRTKMSIMCATNLIAMMKGEKAPNSVY